MYWARLSIVISHKCNTLPLNFAIYIRNHFNIPLEDVGGLCHILLVPMDVRREVQGGAFAHPPLENEKLENITWNEQKNTIFHAKYHDIRSIMCLLKNC